MARRSVAVPDSVAGFSTYFDLNAEARNVLPALGYESDIAELTLPYFTGEVPWVASLAEKLVRLRPRIGLTVEVARREFLIAPVLAEIALQFDGIQVSSEFVINVSERLRGSLDYYVEGPENLIVIEAKLADLNRGFTQLAAEMIAMDQWTDSQSPLLYGAVTMGDAWRFGVLDRSAKRVTQDVDLIPVPADLDRLARVLIGILQGVVITEATTDAAANHRPH